MKKVIPSSSRPPKGIFITKSKRSLISNLSWESSLEFIDNGKKPSQNVLKLIDAGIKQIKDLLWILPLRIQKKPTLTSFNHLCDGMLFYGEGKIIHFKFTPAFGRKGKGRVQLFNASAVVKDLSSEMYLNLKWFNSYPGLKKQLESLSHFQFLGEVQLFKGSFQIINPQINPPNTNDNLLLIDYPTFNSVPGKMIKKLMDKIPNRLWDTPLNYLPEKIEKELQIQSLTASFRILHGKNNSLIENDYKKAREQIIFSEFLNDQLKIHTRRVKNKKLWAPTIVSDDEFIQKKKDLFPYELTSDQTKALEDILSDLQKGNPMMRMIQGDVGCGKTTVAIMSALAVINAGGQVALMCPTEALALQHAKTIESILGLDFNFKLLLGSTKTKEKNDIYEHLKSGKISFVIGTHTLFQDSVRFFNLQLAIIDEQHKFGVEQRQKLVSKGKGVHTLIMTATPIPRTLQLAQYGDLDISTIRTIPANRKGIQTRIVTDQTYEKYLSFIKTRISLGEQVYVVVPAISESETLDLKNVDTHFIIYQKYFPDLKIKALHGLLKSEEKQSILHDFNLGKIDILISTSVIEVGIDVPNATVMSIYSPERFGLSSLHQLRGRVGRGDKPGFCFLICDKKTSRDAIARLQIVEQSHDGFIIAEADLKNRGEGDLFGVNQSGPSHSRGLANIYEHLELFEVAAKKIQEIQKAKPHLLDDIIDHYIQDKKVSSTI